MRTETKEVVTYIASDGKEFLSQNECEIYEKNVIEVKSKIKYYHSICSPDLTEGRGYYGAIYFAVYDTTYCPFERALKYMIDKYGSPIAYVMGCSPMRNWSVPKECTEQEFIGKAGTRVGDYNYKAEQIFISQKEVDGFPKPIWVA